MISSALVAAIGRYSRHFPVNSIARPLPAAAECRRIRLERNPRSSPSCAQAAVRRDSWQVRPLARLRGSVPSRYMRRAMTKMFKIALPDGSVKEMPEGSTPGGRRRRDRAGPRQGRACRQGRRRSARHHAPVRGRFEPRSDHLARREGRARAGPSRLRAHPRRGGAEPLPGHADHLRPGDRRRLLLRFRADRRAAARSPTRTCRRSRRRCGA